MNANVIAELKRIAAENDGILQPETVVEKARPATSPLHSRFEWDNTVAAHQYRIWQARQLIRVTVELLPGTKTTYDVFVSLSADRAEDGGGYRVTTEVLSDAKMRAMMFADALDELETFKKKYKRLTELAAVFDAISKVRRREK